MPGEFPQFPDRYFPGLVPCVRCGNTARGWAMIGPDRLCYFPGGYSCYDIAAPASYGNPEAWRQIKKDWARGHASVHRIQLLAGDQFVGPRVSADIWRTVSSLEKLRLQQGNMPTVQDYVTRTVYNSTHANPGETWGFGSGA